MAAIQCMEQVSADQSWIPYAQPQTPKDGWVRLSAIVENEARPRWVARRSMFDETTERRRARPLKSDFHPNTQSLPHRMHSIHALSQNSAQELFQIFIRLNSAGTPLGAAEQFFAGVKQHWLEAEERLAPLARFGLSSAEIRSRWWPAAAKATPTARFATAIKARRRRDHGGTIRLERLAKAPMVTHPQTGIRHNLLIEDGRHKSRLTALTRRRHAMVYEAFYERLHLGILGISSVSWSAAVAWVLGMWSRLGTRPEMTPEVVDPLLRFCFWPSAAGSRSEGRRKFERNSFNQGWRFGLKGQPSHSCAHAHQTRPGGVRTNGEARLRLHARDQFAHKHR